MIMAVRKETLRVNGRALRKHHPCGLVTLHIHNGYIAITKGVNRRAGWASYMGTRELALKLIRALRAVPKGRPIEIMFVPAITQTRGFLELTKEGYVHIPKEWQARLVIRYDLHEFRLYGWEDLDAPTITTTCLKN